MFQTVYYVTELMSSTPPRLPDGVCVGVLCQCWYRDCSLLQTHVAGNHTAQGESLVPGTHLV